MANGINIMSWLFAVIIITICSISECNAGKLEIKQLPGQAELGTVEIQGVSAGDFSYKSWEAGTLNLLPDNRTPLIEPRK